MNVPLHNLRLQQRAGLRVLTLVRLSAAPYGVQRAAYDCIGLPLLGSRTPSSCGLKLNVPASQDNILTVLVFQPDLLVFKGNTMYFSFTIYSGNVERELKQYSTINTNS